MRTRGIIAGDLLALLAFALFGLASHEHELNGAALARTFLPFAVSWLAIAGATGLLRPGIDGRPQLGWSFLAAYILAGVAALVARSVIFDRTLFSAFFVITLAGNGVFLAGWRALCGRWVSRRSQSVPTGEVSRS
jgi:hypothetical protein